MLYENSDEPYCEELAKAITDEIRKGSRIDTTTKLREVIEKTLYFLPENEIKTADFFCDLIDRTEILQPDRQDILSVPEFFQSLFRLGGLLRVNIGCIDMPLSVQTGKHCFCMPSIS